MDLRSLGALPQDAPTIRKTLYTPDAIALYRKTPAVLTEKQSPLPAGAHHDKCDANC